ncbi:MucR family transcriptional regulator [Brevundimonas diminuta]|uniref:MucR family transcriptional regulator n=1 Tax=Brevundimonas diminuta TaxID=293 RepID=UPI003D9A2DDB
MTDPSPQTSKDLTELTVDIVTSYVANNTVSPEALPELIAVTHAALVSLGADVLTQTEPPATAPTLSRAEIRKSITPEALISFEDGKPYKALKRHLSIRGLTPEDYRAKYGLPVDYPMVAASYSAQRSALAKTLGLGRKVTKTRQRRKKA